MQENRGKLAPIQQPDRNPRGLSNFLFPEPSTTMHPGQCASCATQLLESLQCKPSRLKESDGSTHQNVQPLLAVPYTSYGQKFETYLQEPSQEEQNSVLQASSKWDRQDNFEGFHIWVGSVWDTISAISKDHYIDWPPKILYTKQRQPHTTSESIDSWKHPKDQIH